MGCNEVLSIIKFEIDKIGSEKKSRKLKHSFTMIIHTHRYNKRAVVLALIFNAHSI